MPTWGKSGCRCVSQVKGISRPLFKNFPSWVRDKRVAIDALRPVPSDVELLSTFRPGKRDHWREGDAEVERRRQMMEDGELAPGDGEDGGDSGHGGIGNGYGTADFTMSMCARLCLILRDDDQARLAHAATGQPLTKEQQKNRVSRENYWQTVAERFKDANVTSHKDMQGAPVGDIDPSVAPSIPVLGGELKMVWYDMRGPFTVAHNKFEKSGQHNGTLSRFLDFVQGNGHGYLYAGSKRSVIMSIIMRVGTDIPGARVEGMLGLTLRKIPNGAGFDEPGDGADRVSGSQQSPGSSSREDGNGTGAKRRKKNVCEDTRFFWYHIKGLTDSISGHGDNDRQKSSERQVGSYGTVSVLDGKVRQSIGNSEFQALEYMETRIKAVGLLKRSYAQVVDAESETGGRDNSAYLRTRQQYDNISQDFERAFGSV